MRTIMRAIFNLFESVPHHPIDAGFDNLVPQTQLESFGPRELQDGRLTLANESFLPCPITIEGEKPQGIAFRVPIAPNDEVLIRESPKEAVPVTQVQDDGSRSGIVRIVTMLIDPFGKRYRGSGSGVVIDNKHVVTVAHTIWNRSCGLAFSIAIHRDSRVHSKVYQVDSGALGFHWAEKNIDDNDFAVLHLSEPLPDAIQPLKCALPSSMVTNTTLKATVYGYSDDESWEDKEKGTVLSCSRTMIECESTLFDHKGGTYTGASGGPIIDASGIVLALHKGQSRRSCNANTSVPVNQFGNCIDHFKEAIEIFAGGTPTNGSQIVYGTVMGLHGWIVAPFRWK